MGDQDPVDLAQVPERRLHQRRMTGGIGEIRALRGHGPGTPCPQVAGGLFQRFRRAGDQVEMDRISALLSGDLQPAAAAGPGDGRGGPQYQDAFHAVTRCQKRESSRGSRSRSRSSQRG